MGKVRLVSIPPYWKKHIDANVKSTKHTNAKGAVPYTTEEVKKYFRMYISGYTAKEVADHFEVKKSRVDRALTNKVGATRLWAKLCKENKWRRSGKMKLVDVKTFTEHYA